MLARTDAVLSLACGMIVAVLYVHLGYSFRLGLDLTDDAYYLYNLMHPRSESPFSGFAWLLSPIGKLFGHHVIGYRLLGFGLCAVAAIYLVMSVATLLRDRMNLALPVPLAAGLALALSSFHQAYLPTVSYNNVMMIGVTLMAGGFTRTLAGPVPSNRLWWHFAAVAIGAAMTVHARSLSGIACIVGMGLVALPVARALGLIDDIRHVLWCALALLTGLLLAIVTAVLLGNPGSLYATQLLMAETGGGVELYRDSFVRGWSSLHNYWSKHWIVLAGVISALTIGLLPWKWARTALASVPAALLVGEHLVEMSGKRPETGSAYMLAGLVAMMLFILQSTREPDSLQRAKLLAFRSVVALMLLLLPVIGSIGTSNNIIGQTALSLAPIGVLLALPMSRPLGHASPDRLNAAACFAAIGVGFAVLVAISYQAAQLRENHAYRVKTPLSLHQSELLAAPPELRGIRVSSDTHAHIEELAALVRGTGFTEDDTRVLAIYRSPGSVVATGMAALGPPWTFNHIDDAMFNCPLISQALDNAPPRLLVLLHSQPRPEILECLQRFGFGKRDSWRPIGCVAQTTARPTQSKEPQTCVFEAHRSAGSGEAVQ